MTEIVHKYRDKNHKPVPELKVGDRCYTSGGFNDYSWVSVCEIRKIDVHWVEFNDGHGYWTVDYYIRTDVDKPYLKSVKMHAYHLDNEGLCRIYRTPQEVMDENIREFKDMVIKKAEAMRRTMHRLGYSEEQTKNLLEYKSEQDIGDRESEAE